MDKKMMFFYKRLVSIALITVLWSCSHTKNKAWLELPKELSETSGLACLDDQLWTVNDSGNSATLYQVNSSGDVINHVPLALQNVDWEAISSIGGKLFVADIGNNAGTRQQFELYQIRDTLSKEPKVQSWQIKYPDQPSGFLEAYNHDFDAEALVALSEHTLLLFTKSWRTDISHVYRIDLNSSPSLTMTKQADIVGLPGVVTDAALDPQTGNYLIVGYQNYRRNFLQFAFERQFLPFIATLDKNFQLQQVELLANDGQVEGITVCAGSRWISAEKTDSSPARLWRTSL